MLQDKLKQSHRLAEMYREQCISLESELAKVKEEGDVSREIFQVPLTHVNVLKSADTFLTSCYAVFLEIFYILNNQERTDKTTKRLQLMTQRYKALEKRRAMEVEGYKTDLKNLREKFNDIEKQIIKVKIKLLLFSGNKNYTFIMLCIIKSFQT